MFMGKEGNPIIARAMHRMKIMIVVWVALEIGIFILLGNLFGFANALWILFGFLCLGWLIRPSGPKKSMIDVNHSTRQLIATLFMIPGYLTSLAAIIFLIPPLRRAIMAFVTKRVIPKELRDQFSSTDANRLFDFMNGGNVNVNDSRQTSRTRTTSGTDECIDLDGDAYDVKYSGRYQPTARVERKALGGGSAHETPNNDIIDVEHEFK